ncbi:MAG: hypothetical protein QM765_28065 [Myxococcales bacterium]
MKRLAASTAVVLVSAACLQSVPLEKARQSVKIGSEGGTLTWGESFRAEFPPGALAETTEVAAEVLVDEIVPAELGKAVTRVFSLQPEGTQFAKPVRLVFDVAPADPVKVIVFTAAKKGGEYRPLETEVEGERLVSAQVGHFSLFVAVAVPEVFDCGSTQRCTVGCLGDAQNCSACGDACAGGCYAGECHASGWEKLIDSGPKMVGVWTDGQKVVAAGPGVFISQPNGSFQETRGGAYTYSAWSDGQELIVVCEADRGISRTTDNGQHWRHIDLPKYAGCWTVWGTGDDVWATSDPLYHSRDRGMTWERVETGLPNDRPMAISGHRCEAPVDRRRGDDEHRQRACLRPLQRGRRPRLGAHSGASADVGRARDRPGERVGGGGSRNRAALLGRHLQPASLVPPDQRRVSLGPGGRRRGLCRRQEPLPKRRQGRELEPRAGHERALVLLRSGRNVERDDLRRRPGVALGPFPVMRTRRLGPAA